MNRMPIFVTLKLRSYQKHHRWIINRERKTIIKYTHAEVLKKLATCKHHAGHWLRFVYTQTTAIVVYYYCFYFFPSTYSSSARGLFGNFHYLALYVVVLVSARGRSPPPPYSVNGSTLKFWRNKNFEFFANFYFAFPYQLDSSPLVGYICFLFDFVS